MDGWTQPGCKPCHPRTTSARDETPDAARAADDPAAATALKALRRPSVAAWLVNRLTVGQPGLLGPWSRPSLTPHRAGADADVVVVHARSALSAAEQDQSAATAARQEAESAVTAGQSVVPAAKTRPTRPARRSTCCVAPDPRRAARPATPGDTR